MKDEIKEIDRIIINVKRKLQFSPERRFVELFNKDEINKLLDYITNLQEENERLKELCDRYEEEHSTTFEYWKHLIKEDYKSRNEKAIEYVEHHKFNKFGDIDCGEAEEIINILNGDDEE